MVIVYLPSPGELYDVLCEGAAFRRVAVSTSWSVDVFSRAASLSNYATTYSEAGFCLLAVSCRALCSGRMIYAGGYPWPDGWIDFNGLGY